MLVLLATGLYADDISIPLEDGKVIIHADFVWAPTPELFLELANQSGSPWETLKLDFEVGALCDGDPRQFSVPFIGSLGWSKDFELKKKASVPMFSLVGKVDRCRTEIIRGRLVVAKNSNTSIDSVAEEKPDLHEELKTIKVKRDAEAAALAEEERKAAEEQARQDAEEAARQKRLEAEHTRKQAEADRKTAAERRRLQAVCRVVYRNTIDKKITDLTVREEQQVRACQALGMYPPD